MSASAATSMSAPSPASEHAGSGPVLARGVDPKALFAIRDLELRARVVVEGLWSGLHRSPFSGFSVEFTEYRQYAAGDDLRFMDWRVVARTDRHYIKKFEDETNLRCQLLVDASRSMTFGSLAHTKADYARTLAATVGYFLLQQRDTVGLALFADRVTEFIPARWRPGHLHRMLTALARPAPIGDTRMEKAFDEVGLLWRKRGLVLVISDFLSPAAEWDAALGRLLAVGHDVRAVQVIDPAEETLDFGQAASWEDLETGRRLYVDPTAAARGYRERFVAHQAEVAAALGRRGVPLTLARTDRPLDFVLLDVLGAGSRPRATKRRGRR